MHNQDMQEMLIKVNECVLLIGSLRADLAQGAEPLRKDNARLRELLERAAPAVCSLDCPSRWASGSPQPHGEKCLKIRAAIAEAKGDK